jgi:hypothetical protein
MQGSRSSWPMRKRSPRSESLTGWLLAALVGTLSLALVPASPAHAEPRAAGALTSGLLVLSGPPAGGRRALGGGLAVDLWRAFGALRLGMYTGLQIVGGTDSQALVFTPIAGSLAIALDAERTSFEVRIRAGGYAGAAHDRAFIGGVYLGTGVFLDFSISPHACIGIGGELHLLIGSNNSTEVDSRAYFSPSVTLVYRPAQPAREP